MASFRAVPGGSSAPGSGTWEAVDAQTFSVRGPSYVSDKTKQPSPEALYEPFAVDCVRTLDAAFDVAARVDLSGVAVAEVPDWCPRVVVQTLFVPGTPPAVVGKSKNTAKGWQVVVWWRVAAGAATLIASPEADWPPHLRLWRRWAEGCDSDASLCGRLKGVARVDDGSALPLPVREYNGTPVLMAANAYMFGDRAGVARIHKHAAGASLEFALHFGEDFSHTSYYALRELLPRVTSLTIDVGWIVEGRDAADLPEAVFACARVIRLDLDAAADLESWLGPPGS